MIKSIDNQTARAYALQETLCFGRGHKKILCIFSTLVYVPPRLGPKEVLYL